jgi:hypothetical protein
VQKLKGHNVFTAGAQLIVLGCALGILFGKGAHLHSVFDHLFDHGDVHVVVHGHSSDETSKSDDTPSHKVASLDINGVLSFSGKSKIELETVSVLLSLPGDRDTFLNHQPPTLLNLPPPQKALPQYHSFSFSLRGPPLG